MDLVGLISNELPVLGRGEIGAQALKLVMEDGGVIFNCFMEIDTFDIKYDFNDPKYSTGWRWHVVEFRRHQFKENQGIGVFRNERTIQRAHEQLRFP